MSVPFRIVPFDATIDRRAFDCGDDSLNHYLQQQLSQDSKRRIANGFFALTAEARIAGYYTLSACAVLLADLPPAQRKKLPRYPSVPCAQLGRLAVDKACHGMGLGGALLMDALYRAARADVAVHALIVDAKHAAAAFYRHHGFIPLASAPGKWFFPLAGVDGKKTTILSALYGVFLPL